MGLTAQLNLNRLSAQTEEVQENELWLPKPHSVQQSRLVNAWELRHDPLRPALGLFYNPADLEWDDLPLALPNLRFVIGACGTKFGKTYSCVGILLKKAWENLDPKSGVPLPGQGLYWWVAPTHDQSENAFNTMLTMLPPGSYHENRTKKRIEIVNPDGSVRSVIEFKSGAEPATLRGFGVHFFIMDEAAQGMPEASFTSLMTTVTMTGGCGIIISTPNGRGWFHDKFQRGVKFFEDGTPKFTNIDGDVDPFPHWYALNMPTHVNPYVSLDEIELKRKELSAQNFKQEYLAEFLLESAGVFTNIDGCKRGVLQEPQLGKFYALGVDLGDKKDYTVLTVIDRETNHVVYFERFNKTGWTWQKHRIVAVARKYNMACLSIDTTGIGDPITEDLMLSGLIIKPYKISGNTAKVNLVERLVNAVEQGKISYPNIPVLIHELRMFEVTQTATGKKDYRAPKDLHDDCVISLALAVLVADEPVRKIVYQQRRGF